MIDINVKGADLLGACRASLACLKSNIADVEGVASEAGRRGLPYEAVYCSSKFAQVGLTLPHSTTSCANRAYAAPTYAPVAWPRSSPWVAAGRRRCHSWQSMMRPEDVAEAILFVLTRPRNHRILKEWGCGR